MRRYHRCFPSINAFASPIHLHAHKGERCRVELAAEIHYWAEVAPITESTVEDECLDLSQARFQFAIAHLFDCVALPAAYLSGLAESPGHWWRATPDPPQQFTYVVAPPSLNQSLLTYGVSILAIELSRYQTVALRPPLVES